MMRWQHVVHALSFATALVIGCKDPVGQGQGDPEDVARAYAAAVTSGDIDKVLRFLEPSALARLKGAAQRASDQVGGRRIIAPKEMLQIVDTDPAWVATEIEAVEVDTMHARVRLRGAGGPDVELELVRADESEPWRVRIPVPK